MCGNYEYFPNSAPEPRRVLVVFARSIKNSGTAAAAQKPVHFPQYSTYQNRLNSYGDHWPTGIKQKPDVLAECGFVYDGHGDRTYCYCCGGGLQDWVENDDPWEQHALWFPDCDYLKLKKGQEFIDHVINKAAEDKKSVINKTAEDKKSEENARKDDDDKEINGGAPPCKVCYTNDVAVLFMPCKHIVCCMSCSQAVNSICPMCRKPFSEIIRVFIP